MNPLDPSDPIDVIASYRRQAMGGAHPPRHVIIAFVGRELRDETAMLTIAEHLSACDACAAIANSYRADEEAATGFDPFTGERATATVVSFPIARLRGFSPMTDTLQQAAAGADADVTSEAFSSGQVRGIVSVSGGTVSVQVTAENRPLQNATVRLVVVRESGATVHAAGTTDALGMAALGTPHAVPVETGGHHVVLEVDLEREPGSE